MKKIITKLRFCCVFWQEPQRNCDSIECFDKIYMFVKHTTKSWFRCIIYQNTHQNRVFVVHVNVFCIMFITSLIVFCLNSNGSDKVDLIRCRTWPFLWGPLTWRGRCYREASEANNINTWLMPSGRAKARATWTICRATTSGHSWTSIWRRSSWCPCFDLTGTIVLVMYGSTMCGQSWSLSAMVPRCYHSFEGLCAVVGVSWPSHGTVPYRKQGLLECPCGEVTLGDVLLPPACQRDGHHFGWCVLSPAFASDRQTHWSCPLCLWERLCEDFADDPPWHIDRGRTMVLTTAGARVRLTWMTELYHCYIESISCVWDAMAYLMHMHLVYGTIFIDKSSIHVHLAYLLYLDNLDACHEYTWAVAVLSYLYDHFFYAS